MMLVTTADVTVREPTVYEAVESSFWGEIPLSLTIIAPEESCVVAPSTAPDAKVALLTAAFKFVDVT